MLVTVDCRVGSKHFIEGSRHLKLTLPKVLLPPHRVKLSELPAGDFEWLGNGPDGLIPVVGELVKIGDLLGKIETRRLTDEQLPKLLDRAKVVYLIVEGRWRPQPDGELDVYEGGVGFRGWKKQEWRPSGFKYDSVNGILMSLQAFPRVITVRTLDENETCHWVASAAKWWDKPWEEHRSFEAWSGTTIFGQGFSTQKPKLVQQVAALLPGIGQKRARQVARKFGSIRRLVGATLEDWIGIKSDTGKTKLTARAAQVIQEALDEEPYKGGK